MLRKSLHFFCTTLQQWHDPSPAFHIANIVFEAGNTAPGARMLVSAMVRGAFLSALSKQTYQCNFNWLK